MLAIRVFLNHHYYYSILTHIPWSGQSTPLGVEVANNVGENESRYGLAIVLQGQSLTQTPV